MRTYILVFIIIVSGCNFGELPKTSQGCKIDRRGIPNLPSDIEHSKALDILIYQASKRFDEARIRKVLGLVTIEWWDVVASSPSTGQLDTVVVYNGRVYSGLTVGNICKIAWRGKLFRSAFVHEILHVVGAHILHDLNAYHTNRVLHDIEVTTNNKLFEQNL